MKIIGKIKVKQRPRYESNKAKFDKILYLVSIILQWKNNVFRKI